MPEVIQQLELGVPLARVARKFGVSRQAIYWHLTKSKAPATDQSDTGRLSDVENRQGDDTP